MTERFPEDASAMHAMGDNNNDWKKSHDPWTRGAAAQETPLVNGEGSIYNPNKKRPSGVSSRVQLRKQSVYHHEIHPGTAGFALSVFNLMNAILGSGILGLPYAMAQLGLVLFFVFEIVVAILALYAIHLLLKMCDQTNVKAYEKLGFIAFGTPGKILAAVCILMQNIGAMSSYLFIVKYELPNVIMTFNGVHESDGSWYYNGDILVVIVTICVIAPLASLKNIGFLGYTSGFSISCMFFFTAVVISKTFQIDCPLFNETVFDEYNAAKMEMSQVVTEASHLTPTPGIVEELNATVANMFENVTSLFSLDNQHNNSSNHSSTEYELSPLEEKGYELYMKEGPQQCDAEAFALTDKWAYSIPTMTFSFVCHTAVLPIYAELKSPSASRMQKVSNSSIGVCFILYSLSALFGYLTFYNWTESELLLMYSYVDSSNVMTLVVRLCVLLAVVLTVPLTHFPARKAITFLLFPEKKFSWIHHIGIMIFLLTFINILVVFVPTIREVFGIIGATASTMLVFVLPSIFFLRIDEHSIKESKEKKGALFLGCLGIFVMILSLVLIIIGYAS